jgi:uncharacterized protein YcbX
MVARITALATAPVKGLRLQPREALRLETFGAVDDRRFFLIDKSGRMVNARRIRKLSAVIAHYDPGRRWLSMTFPDGTVVKGTVEPGEPMRPRFFARELPVATVDGGWSQALSTYSGRDVRLVMVADGIPGSDRGFAGTVSLMSRGSVARLERQAGHAVDPRRFRMLIEVDGIEAHAEDAWVGHRLEIGEATVRINGNVGRCIVTGLDPDTGRGDMPALELLRQYRSAADTTEPLAFGVFGQVLIPGLLRLGDPVRLID